MWSRKFDKCIKCGTTEVDHIAKGLCRKCYTSNTEAKHKKHKRHRRGVADDFLTKEKTIELYVNKGLSMTEIGELAGCTRANVHYKLKKFGIKGRSKADARTMALDRRKIKTKRLDDFGNEEEVVFQKIRYNENFFKEWSPEMAYVLGLIYSDGNLHIRKTKSGYKTGTLTFAQKDRELVEKILILMDCDAKIRFKEKCEFDNTTAGELFYFSIENNYIANELLRLGVTPNKSLDMKFPEIPDDYLRHFVRGLFDGDGSVYLVKRTKTIRVKLLSGSREFIDQLNIKMKNRGFREMKISFSHTKENPGAYFIRYNIDSEIKRFYNLIYEGVEPNVYYSRKIEIFNQYFKFTK